MTRNSSPHPLDLGTSLKLKIVIIIYYKICIYEAEAFTSTNKRKQL